MTASSTESEVSIWQIVKWVYLLGLSLFLNLFSTSIVASLFNRIPERDLRIGQILPYVYIIGDVVGRQIAALFNIRAGKRLPYVLLFANLVRVVMAVLFILYAIFPIFKSDIVVLVYCGVFFVSGGFVNSVTYRNVKRAVPNGKYLTKAAAVLNVLFQSGSIFSLALSFTLKATILSAPMT